MKRTHHNNDLRITDVNKNVALKGWVAKTRNLGGLIFIDLRDRYGITQIVVNPQEVSKELYEVTESIRNEYVLDVQGIVIERQSKNPNLPTGDIEIKVTDLKIISTSETPPFEINDESTALEDTRLKYRYLDLRRPKMQHNLKVRSKVTKIVHNFLDELDFIEVETPILTKSTPEGARDYLVPSRIHRGEFYALPQSPQIFKQLCMIGGLERYYQIARCFRDEDLRSDRQPEFTQVDIETSFLTDEEIQSLTEELFVRIMKEIKGIDIKIPFDRLTYYEAMTRFGSDKPDRRFKMELVELNDVFQESNFSVFASTIKNDGYVRAINVKGGADKYSRKDIDRLTEFVKRYQAKGLAFLKYKDGEFSGPINKFLNDQEKSLLKERCSVENNDLLLFVADNFNVSCEALGALRKLIGKEMDLINQDEYNFLWVVDWPLFDYSEIENRYTSAHHPFTAPKEGSLELITKEPGKCLAQAYDVVLNGYEIGGGSIRIHEQDIQNKIFEALGFTLEDAKNQFGFFLDALKYGTPPHGGIALGLDRIIMLLVHTENIRDVLAFPKTLKATSPMTNAPSSVAKKQLDELNIEIKVKESK